MTRGTGSVTIRRASAGDGATVAEIYLAAIRSELPYLHLVHTDVQVRAWFQDYVLPTRRVLLAIAGDEIVGFAAVDQGHLDHLYLRPDRLRSGVGSALLDAAKGHSPQGLELFVFQRNAAARAFYRRHGFVPVAYGSGAANEEHEPDLRMRWTPRS